MSPILKNTLSDFSPLVPFELGVPKLIVLTGKNGAGKSRLFSGIAQGKISYIGSNGETLTQDEIRTVPSNDFAFQGGNLEQVSLISLCQLHKIQIGVVEAEVTLARQSLCDDEEWLSRTDSERRDLSVRALGVIKSEIQNGIGSPPLTPIQAVARSISQIQKDLHNEGCDIGEEDLVKLALQPHFPQLESKLQFSVGDPYSIQLQNLFEMWRRKYAEHFTNNLYVNEGVTNVPIVTDEEFYALHGSRPWDVINRILKESGTELRFKIDEDRIHNPLLSFGQLLLEDTSGTRFPPTGISSGEKVIFQIAMSKYIAAAEQINYVKPKLVLFDEPDAHLHPSLTQLLLDALKREYVDQGINVIMTTHSPTTVGLAEEGSVVFMEQLKEPVIKSRREVVNELLYGQEKLFLVLSGTKIVFVEDGSDVKRLNALCSVLDLNLENRQLIFKCISKKVPNVGAIDGGKGRVRDLINKLGEEKNIVGFIDFDGKERPKVGIYILCEDERYGIENLLLDPRIVVYFLLRYDTKSFASMFQLDIKSSDKIDGLSDTEIQRCIEKVQTDVFGEHSDEKQSIEYEDGRKFFVCSEWLLKPCHDLADMVEEKYNLDSKSADDDCLSYICGQILAEKSGLLPISFRKSIETLLK